MTEAELDRAVAELAGQLRLYAYHTRDSRGCERGFPDWVIIGPRGLLFRENKSPFGLPSAEQTAVGYVLQALGMDWSIWRPDDLATGQIERELQAIAAPERNATQQ